MLEATESMIRGIWGKQRIANTAKHPESKVMDIQFLHYFQYLVKSGCTQILSVLLPKAVESAA